MKCPNNSYLPTQKDGLRAIFDNLIEKQLMTENLAVNEGLNALTYGPRMRVNPALRTLA